ncbi:type I secretion system permease/ATPase [Pseudomonas sp. MWU13-3659]|uniref:type I secretion system permease/ATPase n=1 Tax=Pseudomonas sp. MWU13-3659 TaxID=2986964 RepID=UPI002074CFBF|nr:type I secretion system permease/ATPase [Pseudomonas sp. MWU13-3659]
MSADDNMTSRARPSPGGGDSGLLALVWAAARLGRRLELGQLRHQAGWAEQPLGWVELCRCARWSGLRARAVRSNRERLPLLPLPALLDTRHGWQVLVAVAGQTVTLYCPEHGRQRTMGLAQLEAAWAGRALLLADDRAAGPAPGYGVRWFLPSIVKHVAQIRAVLLLSLVLQLIALVTPLLFEHIIDRVLVARGASSLQVLGIALAALALFEPLYGLLRGGLFSNLAGKVNTELTARLYRHLLQLPMDYFRQRASGEIVARVAQLQPVRQFLTGSALTLLLDLVFCGLFLALMFAYSPQLCAVMALSLLLYLAYWWAVGPLLRRRVLREFEVDASNTGYLTEVVAGIETVKAGAHEQVFEQRWQRQLAVQVKAAFAARCVGIWAGQGVALIHKLSMVLLLWFGVRQVMDGELSPGALVAFNMLAARVTEPVLRLAQIWQDFQHTRVALERMGDILGRPGEQGQGGLASMPMTRGRISLQGVGFRYTHEGREALRDLSVEIEAGSFIGVTGPSGSGKSTLARLLLRLDVPQRGRVLVDGVDLAVADPVALRRTMAVVPQDCVLFTGSIADNIRLRRPQACDREVREAARLAGAASFIEALEQGYDTEVGERGGLLSGGQRQRIALARALLTDPRILILDEATSALDAVSEAALIAQLGEIARGRTVISVAHRLKTLRHAQRVLVIEHGQLTEQGTHAQLLARGGFYARQWALQAGPSVHSGACVVPGKPAITPFEEDRNG